MNGFFNYNANNNFISEREGVNQSGSFNMEELILTFQAFI